MFVMYCDFDMRNDMKHFEQMSSDMQEAHDLIESARGKVMTIGQRQKMAVDLAARMLSEALRIQTRPEKRRQAELARLMRDPRGKAFTTCMTDQCFRTKKTSRAADQLVYLLNSFGIPSYLSFFKRFELGAFQILGKPLAPILIPLATSALRHETSTVILPGEKHALSRHIKKRKAEGVRLNLNHLGEAILGEDEAKNRLNVYLNDLKNPEIDYVSIKISTIFSQINLLSWDKTLEILADRLRELYRAAKPRKFVNLDMEEYRDLRLTVDLFKKVLSEPEFHDFSAGIVLQAYLPDAHEYQKELTEWAMQRVKSRGAPIKIRIVKGANLAMEQFEASVKDWPQAPYTHKVDVDANFKRMVSYGCLPEHAKAVNLGIGSHNLFDIAYTMLLRAEYGVEKDVSFEMLEGMADHIRRVVQTLSKSILLYCPVATKQDFQSAIAYLIRRLDENTGPDNFLRHTFGLKPYSREWESQVRFFAESCERQKEAPLGPRRHQDRKKGEHLTEAKTPFANESDTDFSLPQNRAWLKAIVEDWGNRKFGSILPPTKHQGKGFDPSRPGDVLYTYPLLDWKLVDEALNMAKEAEERWGAASIQKRCDLLGKCAQKMREHRGDFIGVMMADGGKTPLESDPEISEAIDFAEYYRRSMIKMEACRDIKWSPRGTILITPPWNFPISIPAGGILAALVMGNCVLFKPAPEAVLSGWILVNTLWDAGVPKDVLQFINCEDDPVGSRLVKDERIDGVILTGATSTAKLFLKMRPDITLFAETGGKNGIIVSSLSDHDLAIKDIVQSAFGHSGQKCSAASLAILEAELYDDPHFLKQLKDAVESLTVGQTWDLSSKVIPLIREPNAELLKGLTTLEEGESWLVMPKQDPKNKALWSPGVKMGVKEGSFMHQTELFGPVLGIMRAKNLDHAIQLANGTPYGLTSGLQSLDEREHHHWLEKIEAGNLYINRTITGAIVRRQPFGGCKASGFGPGAKAGGPNYVAQMGLAKQVALPQEKAPIGPMLDHLSSFIDKLDLSAEELGLWYASVANYSFWAKKFHHDHDPSKIVGQDNFFKYKTLHGIVLRLTPDAKPLDIYRSCAAALSCDTPIQISFTNGKTSVPVNDQWKHLFPHFKIKEESESQFLERVRLGSFKRIRLLTRPSQDLFVAAAASMTHIAHAPVLASGRFELLHYLHEVAISIDYHRYGNLGVREGELRKPIQ